VNAVSDYDDSEVSKRSRKFPNSSHTSQKMLTTYQVRAAEKLVVPVVEQGHKPRILSNFHSLAAIDEPVSRFRHAARIIRVNFTMQRNNRQQNKDARNVHDDDVYSQLISQQLKSKWI
jgi:hypothetical protein